MKTVLAQNSLPTLLKLTTGCCILIFLLLELWRPHYFLTDDNLCFGYPIYNEAGRHLQHGEWPFVSQYLYGGHYDWSRDVGCLCWHPFYLLPALLADTWAKTWMVDLIALPFFLLTTIGFTLLAHEMRREFKLTICDGWLIFYTLSFVYSMYILIIGPSWLWFLGNQSALPWLALGIFDRNGKRGMLIVAAATLHQFVASYAAMTISNTLFLTLFAVGIARCRKSYTSLFIWCAGNVIAYLLLSPFLAHVLNGFAHSIRSQGLSVYMASVFSVPPTTLLFSFFLGNWTEPLTKALGDPGLVTLQFPYLSSLLACAAAWCLVPALFSPAKWQPIEKLCLAMAAFIMVLVLRPDYINQVLLHIPVLKSIRWPFREILQLLFFIHLLLILRPPVANVGTRRLIVTYSVAMFLLPIPFMRAPSLNPRDIDRQAVLSGDGDRYWNQVRTLLKPGDQIGTVIDRNILWVHGGALPYTYLGTANFPALYRIPCISGYSTTSPMDELPTKTAADLWIGAFAPWQVDTILHERPDLRLIVIDNISPLKISLRTQGQPTIDLTPYLSP